MKFRWEKKYLYWGLTAFLVIAASIVFYFAINKFTVIWGYVKKLLNILAPFTMGFVFAYLLDPIMAFCERLLIISMKKSKYQKKERLCRYLAIFITFIIAGLLVTGFLLMIIPELITSVKSIVDNLQVYLANLETWLAKVISSTPLEGYLTTEVHSINASIIKWATQKLAPEMDTVFNRVFSGVVGTGVLLKNLFVGSIIAIYLLAGKEKFFAQAKKLTYTIFPVKFSNKVIAVTHQSHKVFGGFITGKLIDSFIIFLLCLMGMLILKMPFALLISVIIGITNIVPFFGPIVGAIPCALLVLMVNPLQCLYFVIFILALQQFDGNILGPIILGDSTGLSSFWVIFAILISGGLFGFTGMVIGVPAFAVIYTLIGEYCGGHLKRHELPDDTEEYKELKWIDENDKPVYYEKSEKRFAFSSFKDIFKRNKIKK